MSEKITLARPYAEAVFRLAQENKALKKWSEMLEFVSAVAQDSQVARLATDPRIERDRFTRMLLDICGKNLSKEGANFLRVLQENQRLDLLPEIAQLFEKLRAEAEGRIEARVVSAFEMKPDQQKKIAAALKARFGREVDLVATVNPALIGGIIIRAGDLVIDGSVQGRLRALVSHLNRQR